MNGEGVSYGASYRIVAPDSILALGWTGASRLAGAPGCGQAHGLANSIGLGTAGGCYMRSLMDPSRRTEHQCRYLDMAGENGLDVDEFLNLSVPLSNDQNNWLFFHGQYQRSLIFYDYQTNHWMTVETC